MSMTSKLSMDSAFAMEPISFAKPTLRACQVLSTYFTISAVSSDVRNTGAVRPS